MKPQPPWQYDECRQVGKGYDNPAEVAAYDTRHGQFRDVKRESEAILDRLALPPEAVLIDFGAGTGTLAIQAARRCDETWRRTFARSTPPSAGSSKAC